MATDPLQTNRAVFLRVSGQRIETSSVYRIQQTTCPLPFLTPEDGKRVHPSKSYDLIIIIIIIIIVIIILTN
jgi:hypothetical protein